MGIILPFEEFILVLIDGLPQKYRCYHDIASLQPICEMLLPDWLVNWPEKAPSLSTAPPPHPIAPRNPLKGIRTCVLRPCHDEMREEVFGCSDGNKKHLLFVVKTTNGFFFFFDDGHEICVSKIPWNVATQECFCLMSSF